MTVRTLLCFAALAVYGALGFFFLLTRRGRDFLIWYWMPWWARTNLLLLGIELRVTGTEHLQGAAPAIYVSNHQGLLDIFSVPWVLRGLPMFYVVKHEFRLYPFIGQLAILTDQVFLNRAQRVGSVRSLEKAVDKLRGGMCTVMFPEGQRRSEPGLQPFKKGTFWMAIATGAPVVPITRHARLVGGRVAGPPRARALRDGAQPGHSLTASSGSPCARNPACTSSTPGDSDPGIRHR
ncbi:MAG: 1-acyl-sn-glycerol-3-phosphate acyltransferase [Candidatus Wallbacteria bacterium]|nr:1-acyl-sn-glycerol-3-phosphate acyltransferase [Candidatus Wallbacteria bacterium]